jgi:hypothetical protein
MALAGLSVWRCDGVLGDLGRPRYATHEGHRRPEFRCVVPIKYPSSCVERAWLDRGDD